MARQCDDLRGGVCKWLATQIDLATGPEAPTNRSSREEIRPIFQICKDAIFALGYTISDALMHGGLIDLVAAALRDQRETVPKL